jgi:hypothetical protein
MTGLAGLVARLLGRDRWVHLDYPVRPRPRWGWGRPAHAALAALIEEGREGYRRVLHALLDLREPLARVPADAPRDDTGPSWASEFLPGLDTASLYGFVALGRPATYLEVGSGASTRVVHRAVRDAGLATRIVSIDPAPRAAIDTLCDEIERRPLEDADLARFERLGAGDIVFVDGSHRCFTNSDATVFFLDVLPRLAPGVLVGIHDVYRPYDYPPPWMDRFYSEQYLLAAWLLAGDRLEIVFPATFVSLDAELSRVLDPLWAEPGLGGVARHGGAFWVRVRPAPPQR